MNNKDTCPDRFTARREGRRAFENGYGSFRNPYDRYDENRCDDAARAWRSGWYSAEQEAEERDREAAHQRAVRRQIDDEQAYYEQQLAEQERQEYYAMLDEKAASAGTEEP